MIHRSISSGLRTVHQKGPSVPGFRSSSPSPYRRPVRTADAFQASMRDNVSSLSLLLKFDCGNTDFLEKTSEILEQVSLLSDQAHSPLLGQLEAEELFKIFQRLRGLTNALSGFSFFAPERSPSPAGRQLSALLASSGSELSEVAPELVQKCSAVLALTTPPGLMPSLPHTTAASYPKSICSSSKSAR